MLLFSATTPVWVGRIRLSPTSVGTTSQLTFVSALLTRSKSDGEEHLHPALSQETVAGHMHGKSRQILTALEEGI